MNTSVDNTQTITTTTNNENNSPLTKPRPMLMSLKEIIDIERNPRKNKKIIINLTGTKYDVVFEVAREYFTWNIISEKSELVDDWNIQWYDTYISTDTLRAMCPYQKINHFPGSYNLGRKNLLARNLAKMRKFLPNEYNFYPKTWLLPYQYEEMKSYVDGINDKSAKKKVVLIVKPEASCQGRGIFLTKKVEGQIAPQEHYVVQEYIAEPLLIDDYKFDLRVYALVKSVHPLKIFVYREGLGRFATVKYEKPKKKNMKNMYMHLTNYAVNKKNPEFQFNEEETNDAVGHKRSLTALLKYLGDKGENSEKIFEDICSVISKTICSVQPHLAHIYRTCQPKEENSEMCFEVFGFDIMLDKKI
jgi:tubulin polyglutamylase TTLL6/13